MTFFSGTNAECLYVMPGAGNALATSTTQTIISANTTTNPPYQMPALNQLWGGSSYAYGGRALRFVARGLFGTTGTPTLKIVCGLNTTQGTATPAITLVSTGAFTAPSTITNGTWELEFGIDVNTVGTTASNLDCLGKLTLGAANNAATTTAASYMVGGPAITNVVPSTSYFVELAAVWGTSSSSNTIQCTQFEVLGLN